MAYFPIIEYNQITDAKVQKIYQEISAELGFGMVPNLFKSMTLNPDFLETSWKKFRAVILSGILPRTLKEMIGVVISQANHSPYALQVHLHSLSALGISEELLRLLVEDFDQCPLPQRQKAAIQFGLLAATQPHNLTITDYQALHEIGLNDAELFEIVATANVFTDVNQYTDAINLEIDRL
ncbi:carboxymuconolactone decarboxylase family protein [soil metagenome]